MDSTATVAAVAGGLPTGSRFLIDDEMIDSDEPPIERVNRRSAIESTIGASSARLSLAKLRPRRASLRFTEQPQSSKTREQNDSSGQTANMAESTSDSEHEMAAAPVIQPSLLTNVRPHSSHAFPNTASESSQ